MTTALASTDHAAQLVTLWLHGCSRRTPPGDGAAATVLRSRQRGAQSAPEAC